MGNTQAVASSGDFDPRDVERLETRADEMATRIAALEICLKEVVPAVPGPVADVSAAGDLSTAQLTAAYVSELESLRAVLVAAEREHQELVAKVSALEAANVKLAYQVVHLKRNYRS